MQNTPESAASSSTIAAWNEALRQERAGRFHLAAENLYKCREVAGLDAADVYFHLGWCLECEGNDPIAARAHYEHAAALADQGLTAFRFNALFRAAMVAINCRDFEVAIARLESALNSAGPAARDSEQDLQATYWLGVSCEATGRTLDALARYEAVARADAGPLGEEARYRRLLCLISIGSFDEAIACAEELIAASIGESTPRGAELRNLAADELRELLDARAQA